MTIPTGTRCIFLSTALKINSTILPATQYAPFLSYHDQNRTMFALGNDTNKAKAAALGVEVNGGFANEDPVSPFAHFTTCIIH